MAAGASVAWAICWTGDDGMRGVFAAAAAGTGFVASMGGVEPLCAETTKAPSPKTASTPTVISADRMVPR